MDKKETKTMIHVFELLALRSALELEAKGIEFTPSRLSIAKKRYGLKGSRESVTAQVNAIAEDIKQQIKDRGKE